MEQLEEEGGISIHGKILKDLRFADHVLHAKWTTKDGEHAQRSEQKIKPGNKHKMTQVMVASGEEEPVAVTLESIRTGHSRTVCVFLKHGVI